MRVMTMHGCSDLTTLAMHSLDPANKDPRYSGASASFYPFTIRMIKVKAYKYCSLACSVARTSTASMRERPP